MLNDLTLGHVYSIGSPSTLHYQYIYPIINFEKMNIVDFEEFTAIKGLLVKFTSILNMVNGKRIAVLRHYKDELILNRFDKIFADISNSVNSKEIISVDCETR